MVQIIYWAFSQDFSHYILINMLISIWGDKKTEAHRGLGSKERSELKTQFIWLLLTEEEGGWPVGWGAVGVGCPDRRA